LLLRSLLRLRLTTHAVINRADKGPFPFPRADIFQAPRTISTGWYRAADAIATLTTGLAIDGLGFSPKAEN